MSKTRDWGDNPQDSDEENAKAEKNAEDNAEENRVPARSGAELWLHARRKFRGVTAFEEYAPVHHEFDAADRFRIFMVQQFGSEKEVFDFFDIDQNGNISLAELEDAFIRLRLSPYEVTMGAGEFGRGVTSKELFELMDIDATGAITFYEMFATTTEMRSHARERKAAGWRPDNDVERFRAFMIIQFGSAIEAFKAMDADRNGEMSFAEIQEALDRLHVSIEDASGCKDLEDLFGQLDFEQRGSLDYYDLFGSTAVERENKTRRAKRKEIDTSTLEFFGKNRRKGLGSLSQASTTFGSSAGFRSTGTGFYDRIQEEEAEERAKQLGLDLPALNIIDAFGKNLAITEIDLKHRCTGFKGAEYLAKAWNEQMGLRMVEVIDLSGNYISDAGVMEIASAIEGHGAVERFILAWNGIGDDGAIRVAKMVDKVAALTNLNLSFNRISDKGAIKLAQSFKSREFVEDHELTLDIRSNQIHDEGIRELMDLNKRFDVTVKFASNSQSKVLKKKMKLEKEIRTHDEQLDGPKPIALWFRRKRQLEDARIGLGTALLSARCYGNLPLLQAGWVARKSTPQVEQAGRELPPLLDDHDFARLPSRERLDRIGYERISTPSVVRLPTCLPGHEFPPWPAAQQCARALSEASLVGQKGKKKRKSVALPKRPMSQMSGASSRSRSSARGARHQSVVTLPPAHP